MASLIYELGLIEEKRKKCAEDILNENIFSNSQITTALNEAEDNLIGIVDSIPNLGLIEKVRLYGNMLPNATKLALYGKLEDEKNKTAKSLFKELSNSIDKSKVKDIEKN